MKRTYEMRMRKISNIFNNERHEILKLLTKEKMKRVAQEAGLSYITLFYFKEGIHSTERTKRKIKMFLQRKIKD